MDSIWMLGWLVRVCARKNESRMPKEHFTFFGRTDGDEQLNQFICIVSPLTPIMREELHNLEMFYSIYVFTPRIEWHILHDIFN